MVTRKSKKINTIKKWSSSNVSSIISLILIPFLLLLRTTEMVLARERTVVITYSINSIPTRRAIYINENNRCLYYIYENLRWKKTYDKTLLTYKECIEGYKQNEWCKANYSPLIKEIQKLINILGGSISITKIIKRVLLKT